MDSDWLRNLYSAAVVPDAVFYFKLPASDLLVRNFQKCWTTGSLATTLGDQRGGRQLSHRPGADRALLRHGRWRHGAGAGAAAAGVDTRNQAQCRRHRVASAGHRRAGRVAGLLQCGLQPHQSTAAIDDAWCAWSFQVNFMFKPVLKVNY